MMNKTLELNGKLEFGENNVLFLSTNDDPIAETLNETISGRNVSVRYWISDKEFTKAEAQESAFYTMLGYADTDYRVHYSEITGYLWTDEGVIIGGHDLLAELKSHVGSWLHLEIDIHGDTSKLSVVGR